MSTTSTVPEDDALLHHMAERLTAFLALPNKRVSSVEKGLGLLRESLAIWTMHDLPRVASPPVATDDGHAGTVKGWQPLPASPTTDTTGGELLRLFTENRHKHGHDGKFDGT